MSGFNMPPGVSVYDIPGNSIEEVRYERSYDEALADLLEGDLPAHLDLSECRELLATVMAELFSRLRDFDSTPQDHIQTCVVFARAAIERAAERVAQNIAEDS